MQADEVGAIGTVGLRAEGVQRCGKTFVDGIACDIGCHGGERYSSQFIGADVTHHEDCHEGEGVLYRVLAHDQASLIQ